MFAFLEEALSVIIRYTGLDVLKAGLAKEVVTRNSSGDEIANVNFLYDGIVHALKIQYTLA